MPPQQSLPTNQPRPTKTPDQLIKAGIIVILVVWGGAIAGNLLIAVLFAKMGPGALLLLIPAALIGLTVLIGTVVGAVMVIIGIARKKQRRSAR